MTNETPTDPETTGESPVFQWLRLWLPPLLWMTFIFCMSTTLGSSANTRGRLFEALAFIWPHVRELPISTQNAIEYALRKTGHLSEYGIFGAIMLRAIFGSGVPFPRAVGWSFISLALYASLDELHQRFVPGRTSSAFDVGYDAVGGMLGMLLYSLGTRRGSDE